MSPALLGRATDPEGDSGRVAVTKLGSALLRRYRRGGADLPFTDPARDHGAPFEGWFWRFTDAANNSVAVALRGVSAVGDERWALNCLAVHPGGDVRFDIVPPSAWDTSAFRVEGGALGSSGAVLEMSLAGGGWAQIEVAEPLWWPRRVLGGSGLAHLLPGLPHYWHPTMLGGRASGSVVVAGRRIDLNGASAYAERTWGTAFPHRWWWGQSAAFADGDVCVAFAGGPVSILGVRVAPSLICVRVGAELIALAPPLARVAAAASGGAWQVRARSHQHEVELEGDDGGTAVVLPSPAPNRVGVEARSRQALAGRLAVRVRRGLRTIFAGESSLAGLEHEAPSQEA